MIFSTEMLALQFILAIVRCVPISNWTTEQLRKSNKKKKTQVKLVILCIGFVVEAMF